MPSQPVMATMARAAAGVAGFLAFDAAVCGAMDASGLSAYLPKQIGSMLSAFACLSVASVAQPAPVAALHAALLPGVGWVSRWLPVFLVPVQVMLPTIDFPGGAREAAGLGLLLAGGWLGALALSARLCRLLQSALQIAAPAAPPTAAAPAAARSLQLPALWLLLAALAFPAGAGSDPADGGAAIGGEAARGARGLCLMALGVGSYALALQRKLPGHLCFLACGGATSAGVALMAAVRGETYTDVVKRDYLTRGAGPKGSGDMLIWCLGPALVATGVQMFQYRARIRALSPLLLGTCAAVSLANILGTVAAAPLLGVSPEVSLAATMRCVTIPMALPTHSMLCDAAGMEANVGYVALCAGVSGFLGFGLSRAVLSSAVCGAPLAQPVARGIATGISAHALGSATFAAAEPEAFVWGMLAMAASGVASAAWICACPPVRDLTIWLATRGAAEASGQ